MASTVTPKRILVAVDFGAASASAARLAGRLASAFGATVSVVHAEVVDVPPYFTRDQLDQLEAEVRAARHRAEEEVRKFVSEQTSVTFDVHLFEKPAVDAILDLAVTADLVVMGTHGRRGPTRWWLGSVAERVVRGASVPVLVVHASPEASEAAALNPTLLTTGGEAPAETRAWADALAAALGGTVAPGPPLEQCETATVSGMAILVVTLPRRPGGRVVHEGVTALARNCSVPVLFVPA